MGPHIELRKSSATGGHIKEVTETKAQSTVENKGINVIFQETNPNNARLAILVLDKSNSR